MENSPILSDTPELEYSGQLRRRNRTRTPLVVPPPIVEETDEDPLTKKMNDYQIVIREYYPCAQFDKYFTDGKQAECQVLGFSADIENLMRIQSECFKFFIEDGRLIMRYIEVKKKQKINYPFGYYTIFILWFLALIGTLIFIYTNFENYKNILV